MRVNVVNFFLDFCILQMNDMLKEIHECIFMFALPQILEWSYKGNSAKKKSIAQRPVISMTNFCT